MGVQTALTWQTIHHTFDMPMAKLLFTKLLKTNCKQGVEEGNYFQGKDLKKRHHEPKSRRMAEVFWGMGGTLEEDCLCH